MRNLLLTADRRVGHRRSPPPYGIEGDMGSLIADDGYNGVYALVNRKGCNIPPRLDAWYSAARVIVFPQ